MDYNILKGLDEKYGSPFYIMNSEQYKKNINDFLNAFKRKYEKVIAGYSFKTNYVPALCKIAARIRPEMANSMLRTRVAEKFF